MSLLRNATTGFVIAAHVERAGTFLERLIGLLARPTFAQTKGFESIIALPFTLLECGRRSTLFCTTIRHTVRSERLRRVLAESVRAYVEANDPYSLWPRVTRERLRQTCPAMFALVEEVLA